MRSLFHFPLPCLAVTVSYSNRPTAPEMSRRPHPAPMRRQRRSPVLLSAARPLPGPALTGPRPTAARSQGARHAAPPSLPRAAARSHRAPSPEYRPAAARTHWARLVRIAPIACRRPHRIYPTACRHPRHPPHLSPRVAAAPGPWLARIAPYASLFRRMREKGPLPGNIRPKCMLFEIKMATSSPHASIPGRNRAIRDTWRANLAAKGPFSRRGARNHAWREDVASAARPFSGSGLRSGRTGFAPCGAGLACLPHAPPPAISLVSAAACAPLPSRPRSSPPSYTRRASPPASRPPRPAIRRASPCRAGPAAVPVIPVKWCGDTIAHTRKLRF